MKAMYVLAMLASVPATALAVNCGSNGSARLQSVDGPLDVCLAPAVNSGAPIPNAPTDLASVQIEFAVAPTTAGFKRHALNAYGTFTNVGGAFFGAVGGDFSPNGLTYTALTRTNTNVPGSVNGIGTINTATGVVGAITPLTGLGAENPLGMAIDPTSGAAFITTREAGVATRLRSVNLATGATTLIGQIGTAFSSIDIAIDCTGNMFAITPAAAAPGSVLSRIDRTTAAATTVGNYNQLGLGFFQSIDFDNQSGTLYGWLTTGDATTTTFAYGTFNTTTAAFNPLFTAPVGQMFGAIPTLCPAPVGPAVFRQAPALRDGGKLALLLAVAGLALLTLRRKA
jgi:hypothetical protein